MVDIDLSFSVVPQRAQEWDPTPYDPRVPLEWGDDAACKGMNPELFFATRDDNSITTREAKKVCAGCPVKTQCLELGLTEKFGVWGGMSERDRRKYRRRTRYTNLRNLNWCALCASGTHGCRSGSLCACTSCPETS